MLYINRVKLLPLRPCDSFSPFSVHIPVLILAFDSKANEMHYITQNTMISNTPGVDGVDSSPDVLSKFVKALFPLAPFCTLKNVLVTDPRRKGEFKLAPLLA